MYIIAYYIRTSKYLFWYNAAALSSGGRLRTESCSRPAMELQPVAGVIPYDLASRVLC